MVSILLAPFVTKVKLACPKLLVKLSAHCILGSRVDLRTQGRDGMVFLL